MSAVPTIRPYATREEWRRDFQVDSATHQASSLAGLATFREAPTLDVWDVLDRETGALLDEARTWYDPSLWLDANEVAYNRRTGEVVYGRGVQS